LYSTIYVKNNFKKDIRKKII